LVGRSRGTVLSSNTTQSAIDVDESGPRLYYCHVSTVNQRIIYTQTHAFTTVKHYILAAS